MVIKEGSVSNMVIKYSSTLVLYKLSGSIMIKNFSIFLWFHSINGLKLIMHKHVAKSIKIRKMEEATWPTHVTVAVINPRWKTCTSHFQTRIIEFVILDELEANILASPHVSSKLKVSKVPSSAPTKNANCNQFTPHQKKHKKNTNSAQANCTKVNSTRNKECTQLYY